MALADLLAARRFDRAVMFQAVTGRQPAGWQADWLRARPTRTAFVCSRQAGKSTTVVVDMLDTILRDDALGVILSGSQRQANAAIRIAKRGCLRMGVELVGDSQSQISILGGGTLIAVPSTAGTSRGLSADVLALDEAAYVAGDVWAGISPSLAARFDAGGRLIVASSAGPPAGWYFELCQAAEADPGWWHRQVRWDDTDHLSRAWIAEEQARMTAVDFRREYLAEFVAASGSVFDLESWRAGAVVAGDRVEWDPWADEIGVGA